jgi:hypothetical protein
VVILQFEWWLLELIELIELIELAVQLGVVPLGV